MRISWRRIQCCTGRVLQRPQSEDGSGNREVGNRHMRLSRPRFVRHISKNFCESLRTCWVAQTSRIEPCGHQTWTLSQRIRHLRERALLFTAQHGTNAKAVTHPFKPRYTRRVCALRRDLMSTQEGDEHSPEERESDGRHVEGTWRDSERGGRKTRGRRRDRRNVYNGVRPDLLCLMGPNDITR